MRQTIDGKTPHKKIRMVLSDLDGTLLSPDRSICDEAVSLVDELRRDGVLFSFITGRPPYAVRRFAERVGIQTPVVCCNGAVLEEGGKEFERYSFPLRPLQNLIEKSAAPGMTVLIYADGTEYALSLTDWVSERKRRGGNFPLWDRSDFDRQVQKVTVMAEKNRKEFSDLLPEIQALEKDFSLFIYGDAGCEIVAAHIDKAFGLRKLCARFGIGEDEVLAIGDGPNDRSMLHIAGVGAAVYNADAETKSIADYCCEASYTEGVIEAVRTFVFADRRSCVM